MRPASLSPLLLAAGLLAVAGCSQYQPVDTAAELRSTLDQRLDKAQAAAVEVPFALDDEITRLLDETYHPGPDELRRVEHVLDFIFRRVGLRYSLNPTRDAVGTFAAREGNCLSFVNLFVGVARYERLNPFYVEVTDYQRWNYREGLVVSRGHIVAGMYVKGELKTYDFLPYRTKAYKDFKPIDDVTATAHFYNNLGAEALLDGDLEQALSLLEIAHRIAPDFVKSLNNLGVVYARQGEVERAIDLYQKGLAIAPDDVALLTNLARGYQQQGRVQEALELLSRIEGVNNTNPYFYLYKGELALAEGDLDAALSYMADALRRDSELPEVHLGLVKVYLARGDLAKARHHLSRALRLDATDPEALRYAAMLADREAREPKPSGDGGPK
jgi:tetratricopeptide (TPR) repeat protein